MGYSADRCGFTRLTSSGVVGDSGKPILVAGYAVESGATAAKPYIRNGTVVTDPTAFQPGPISVSTGNVQSLPLPVMLYNGCYVSFDANTTAVTIFYIQQAVS